MSTAPSSPTQPVVLLILDGVGLGAEDEFDAVHRADTPATGELARQGACRHLQAHGTAVGLPSDGDMGNSEVGHNIMGAGRILPQGATQVNLAVTSGDLWDSPSWTELVGNCRQHGSTLHLIGLVSDGNVHSHIDHLEALVRRAADEGIESIRVHALFDGRDVPDGSAEHYLEQLDALLAAVPVDARVASGGGRMLVTMDRYGADWPMVERGWQAHVRGAATPYTSAADALAAARAQGIEGDQFLPAFTIVDDEGAPVGPIVDGDSVVLFNFRGDRMLELTEAFEAETFEHFDRGSVPQVCFAGMTLYDGDRGLPSRYLVQPPAVADTVSELIAAAGIRQYATAETQKYGHVTYFWNGNRSNKFDESLEDYHEIPSDSHPFEQRPWMRSAETADAVIAAIESGRYGFIRANFAGGDMVGHTGRLPATILAVEAVDLAIGRIHQALRSHGSGTLIVTADHGNADDMVERDADGTPKRRPDDSAVARTSHSLNPVPLVIARADGSPVELRSDLDTAGLANLAATLLELLGLTAPDDYEPSLLG